MAAAARTLDTLYRPTSGEATAASPPGQARRNERVPEVQDDLPRADIRPGFSPNVTRRASGVPSAILAASLSPQGSSMLTTATRGTGPTPPVNSRDLTSK